MIRPFRVTRPTAITGGQGVPSLLIRDGRIEAVGAAVTPPAEADVVDATGLWVVPGFVEPHAHAGIHEESSGTPGDDTNESAGPNMAGVRALDGINIEDPAFTDALLGGVTTAIIKPGSANPFGGQVAAIKTAGGATVDSRLVSDSVAVKSAFGENPKSAHGTEGRSPVTRMGTAYLMRQALRDARHAEEHGDGQTDMHGETLARVLSGELAWDVHAHRHDDIASALRIADEFGLRLVLNHGTEAYKLVGEIVARGVPVIVGPLFSARSKVELSGARWSTAAILDDAGVQVGLMTDHPEVPLHLLVTQAAFAMREGLSRDAAYRAITETPADIYGLAERVGRIEPARDADIVLWDGDPFDARSRVERVYIDGVVVYDRDPSRW